MPRLAGIVHDVTRLLLGVKTSVAGAVKALLAVGPSLGSRTPSAHLRQLGVFLDFNAPALVLRQSANGSG